MIESQLTFRRFWEAQAGAGRTFADLLKKRAAERAAGAQPVAQTPNTPTTPTTPTTPPKPVASPGSPVQVKTQTPPAPPATPKPAPPIALKTRLATPVAPKAQGPVKFEKEKNLDDRIIHYATYQDKLYSLGPGYKWIDASTLRPFNNPPDEMVQYARGVREGGDNFDQDDSEDFAELDSEIFGATDPEIKRANLDQLEGSDVYADLKQRWIDASINLTFGTEGKRKITNAKRGTPVANLEAPEPGQSSVLAGGKKKVGAADKGAATKQDVEALYDEFDGLIEAGVEDRSMSFIDIIKDLKSRVEQLEVQVANNADDSEEEDGENPFGDIFTDPEEERRPRLRGQSTEEATSIRLAVRKFHKLIAEQTTMKAIIQAHRKPF